MFLQVVEGMNYAMCIIASIMGQAVETGSTPVLQAWRAEYVKPWSSSYHGAMGFPDRKKGCVINPLGFIMIHQPDILLLTID